MAAKKSDKGSYGFAYGAECPKCHDVGTAIIEHPDKAHILELLCSCGHQWALESPFPGWVSIR